MTTEYADQVAQRLVRAVEVLPNDAGGPVCASAYALGALWFTWDPVTL